MSDTSIETMGSYVGQQTGEDEEERKDCPAGFGSREECEKDHIEAVVQQGPVPGGVFIEDDDDGNESTSYRKPLIDFTAREIGMEGERLAASYLVRRGYRILDRNWRCMGGEIDIVACEEDEDRECVVLVEVKTRLALGDEAECMPELAVDTKKMARYRQLALYYMLDRPEVKSIRFDVIAINITGERRAKLRHLMGAYGWDEQ